jgi:hypothetical protein
MVALCFPDHLEGIFVFSQSTELRMSQVIRSRKSIRATFSGRSQTHSFIFSAVSPWPNQPAANSGTLVEGVISFPSNQVFRNVDSAIVSPRA